MFFNLIEGEDENKKKKLRKVFVYIIQLYEVLRFYDQFLYHYHENDTFSLNFEI